MKGYTLTCVLALVALSCAAELPKDLPFLLQAVGEANVNGVDSPQLRANVSWATNCGGDTRLTKLDVPNCNSRSNCNLNVNKQDITAEFIAPRSRPLFFSIYLNNQGGEVALPNTPVAGIGYSIITTLTLSNAGFKKGDKIDVRMSARDSANTLFCVQFTSGSEVAFGSVALLAILQVVRQLWS